MNRNIGEQQLTVIHVLVLCRCLYILIPVFVLCSPILEEIKNISSCLSFKVYTCIDKQTKCLFNHTSDANIYD